MAFYSLCKHTSIAPPVETASSFVPRRLFLVGKIPGAELTSLSLPSTARFALWGGQRPAAAVWSCGYALRGAVGAAAGAPQQSNASESHRRTSRSTRASLHRHTLHTWVLHLMLHHQQMAMAWHFEEDDRCELQPCLGLPEAKHPALSLGV